MTRQTIMECYAMHMGLWKGWNIFKKGGSCKLQLPQVKVKIPSGDSNPGLRVSVYLNLTHAQKHSATTAGFMTSLNIIHFLNQGCV